MNLLFLLALSPVLSTWLTDFTMQQKLCEDVFPLLTLDVLLKLACTTKSLRDLVDLFISEHYKDKNGEYIIQPIYSDLWWYWRRDENHLGLSAAIDNWILMDSMSSLDDVALGRALTKNPPSCLLKRSFYRLKKIENFPLKDFIAGYFQNAMAETCREKHMEAGNFFGVWFTHFKELNLFRLLNEFPEIMECLGHESGFYPAGEFVYQNREKFLQLLPNDGDLFDLLKDTNFSRSFSNSGSERVFTMASYLVDEKNEPSYVDAFLVNQHRFSETFSSDTPIFNLVKSCRLPSAITTACASLDVWSEEEMARAVITELALRQDGHLVYLKGRLNGLIKLEDCKDLKLEVFKDLKPLIAAEAAIFLGADVAVLSILLSAIAALDENSHIYLIKLAMYLARSEDCILTILHAGQHLDWITNSKLWKEPQWYRNAIRIPRLSYPTLMELYKKAPSSKFFSFFLSSTHDDDYALGFLEHLCAEGDFNARKAADALTFWKYPKSFISLLLLDPHNVITSSRSYFFHIAEEDERVWHYFYHHYQQLPEHLVITTLDEIIAGPRILSIRRKSFLWFALTSLQGSEELDDVESDFLERYRIESTRDGGMEVSKHLPLDCTNI